MRALSLALIASLTLAGPLAAAPTKKKAKNESPPVAQPDSTLVAPDIIPPPPTFAVATRPVEMQPIGAPGAKPAALAPMTLPTAAAPAPQPSPPAPPAPPPAPPQPPVLAHAEVCLRAEAPRAARAEASVKAAVDLLLEDLCGGEVERASLYAHNIDALARFTPQSERAAAGLSAARVDPETGEIVNPPAADVSGALAAGGFDRSDVGTAPQLRRFAAELVLEAKAAESKGEPRKH